MNADTVAIWFMVWLAAICTGAALGLWIAARRGALVFLALAVGFAGVPLFYAYRLVSEP